MSISQPYQEKLQISFLPNVRSGVSVAGSAITRGWLIFCCGFECYAPKIISCDGFKCMEIMPGKELPK